MKRQNIVNMVQKHNVCVVLLDILQMICQDKVMVSMGIVIVMLVVQAMVSMVVKFGPPDD